MKNPRYHNLSVHAVALMHWCNQICTIYCCSSTILPSPDIRCCIPFLLVPFLNWWYIIWYSNQTAHIYINKSRNFYRFLFTCTLLVACICSNLFSFYLSSIIKINAIRLYTLLFNFALAFVLRFFSSFSWFLRPWSSWKKVFF